jgi:hypothetical protein
MELGSVTLKINNQHTQAHPVLKYRVPHGSHRMVGIRSPIRLVVGSCTSHLGVLGSIPKREEPGKTGAPCVKVPGSSRVPAPPWVGSRSPDGSRLGSDFLSAWWLDLAPVTLEFWVRFPNERNQGKQAHPVLKYRVPHGSQCVMSRLIHTGLGSSSLIVHVLHSPPPPREQFCNRSCSNKTHTHLS